MPTYTVQLNVNVPGLGDRNVLQPGIIAPTIEDAIQQAKQGVIVTVLAAQRTAA